MSTVPDNELDAAAGRESGQRESAGNQGFSPGRLLSEFMSDLRQLPWGTLLIVLAAVALLLLLFHETTAGIVRTWTNSVTYNHGFMIVPITLFLLWMRRHTLAACIVRPDPVALIFLLGAAFVWLLGEMVDVNVVREFALVTMLIALVWFITGRAATRKMAFPLVFLYFAVPFGDFLVMPLMIFTADVAIGLVRLTGIPVFREGMYFSLPTGNWAVVEACSGIRYLIASFTLGALFAYLMYRTFWRIAIFMVLAVVVPIIANALRAYMIVMIGHLSGMELAVGVDHLLYGWVFFGVVIFLMFWIGSFFRQDGVIESRQGRAATMHAGAHGNTRATLAVAAVLGLGLTILFPVAAAYLDNPDRYPQPTLQAPAAAGGWAVADEADLSWKPNYHNPRASFHQAFINSDDALVYAFGAYYNDQRRRGDLLFWRNSVVNTNFRHYRVMHQRGQRLPGSIPGTVREVQVRGPEGDFIAWEWFWVDGDTTVRRWEIKARESLSRLLGRGDDAAVIILYTYHQDDPDQARAVLQTFLQDMSAPLHKSLDNANQH